MKYVLKDRLMKLEDDYKYQEGEQQVWTMPAEAFQNVTGHIPHKKLFIHYLSNIQYCKAELAGDCIIGTMVIPEKEDLLQTRYRFGFYLNRNVLYFVGDTAYAERILMEMKTQGYGTDCTLADLLIDFMEIMIQGDVPYLQHLEEKLSLIEEGLLDHIPKNFYKTVIHYRKQLLVLHTCYEQLIDAGDDLQGAAERLFGEREALRFGMFTARAERLHNHVEMLREYVLQIREMYQSQIDISQNHMMNMLTVVTSLFLPLSILVGWYGMNFTNMPELSWKYGYAAMAGASVLIIILEILFFKKKKLL